MSDLLFYVDADCHYCGKELHSWGYDEEDAVKAVWELFLYHRRYKCSG